MTEMERLLSASLELTRLYRYVERLERQMDHLRRENGKLRLLKDMRKDVRELLDAELPALLRPQA